MALMNHCPHYDIHDDYYTPFSAWDNIEHIIPDGTTIWEACMLNSTQSSSVEHLRNIKPSCEVIYDNSMDCLTDNPTRFDMIITNPPFQTDLKKRILKRFIELDKPFILILNSMNLYTKYFRDIFGDNIKYLQVILPSGKINFLKLEDNELVEKNNCAFYSIYLCYKMNLKNEDLWLK